MAETITLHCQEYFDYPTNKTTIDQATVTGIEMPDGSFFRGFHFNTIGPKETQIPLEWDSNKAENLAEYYERHLVARNPEAPGWNCHSFAAAIMGWEVAWEKGGTAYLFPGVVAHTNPRYLQDQQAYAVRRPLRIAHHSMVGMPNPEFNLGVWGFRGPLRIVSNWQTLQHYEGNIYRRFTPLPLVNRVAALFPSLSTELPVSLPPKPEQGGALSYDSM